MGTSSPVPSTGPIRIDCRGASGPVAVRRVEAVLKRIRRGARALVVQIDALDVLETMIGWSAQGGALHELVRRKAFTELRIYLLPADFDEHPLLAWRPPLQHADTRVLAVAG